ncbi:glycosyltransferase [Nitratifractor sp.]
MKKRLAILLYSMAAGGAERVVSVLLPELVRHYDVTLVLMNDTIAYSVPDEVEVHWLERSSPEEPGSKKLLKLPWLAWRYARWLRSQGIGVSLSFMARPNYINALASHMGSEARTLLAERAFPSSQHGYGDLQSTINRILIRGLYPMADRICANAEANRHDLIGHFGLDPEKVVTIHNPFDLEKIAAEAQRGREGKEPGEFVYLSVGRLDRGKNHRLLIEAFARIRRPGMRLRIVGEGPLCSELEELCRRLVLEDAVELLGYREDAFALMGAADAFVFGSRHEGFPNVLVEALACGLPVISTDCPGAPREILAPGTETPSRWRGPEEGRYGVLVPVDDAESMALAMERVYNSETLRTRYRKAAKRRAADFDKSVIVPRWLAAIKNLEKRVENG